jgi:hypothetical protein
VNIAVEHPDAGDPLLACLAAALEGWGARVCVAVDADNLVRRLQSRGSDRLATRPEEIASAGLPDPHARKGAPVAEVWAQGLPNLLHELIHVVLADRLDDDHGIDYQAIPYDLSTVSGRRVLFEELACCVVSCAYLSRPKLRSTPPESRACTEARVDAWFAEQIEIQPVFYGMEDCLPAFIDRVHTVARQFAGEQEALMNLAYDRVERALLAVGAPRELARPGQRLTLEDMLRRRHRREHP